MLLDAKVIGERLKAERLKAGLKREDVAVACGLSGSTVAMYELGLRSPKDPAKCKLAQLFNTTVDALFFSP